MTTSSPYVTKPSIVPPAVDEEPIVDPCDIHSPPGKPFEFTCQAAEGSNPKVIFADSGEPVENDPRFVVTYKQENVIHVSAPNGLPPDTGRMTIL